MIPEFDSKALTKIAFQKVSKTSLAASIAFNILAEKARTRT